MRFKEPTQTITLAQFKERVEQGGEQLVILDDLVLNVASFARYHPGGSFMLTHNVGRDVSKFFYGGYALSNCSSSQLLKENHRHTNMARKVVNSLIVGRLVQQAPEIAYQITERASVNEFTQTLVLTAT